MIILSGDMGKMIQWFTCGFWWQHLRQVPVPEVPTSLTWHLTWCWNPKTPSANQIRHLWLMTSIYVYIYIHICMSYYILYVYTVYIPTCDPNKCPPKNSVEERFVHPLPLGSLGIHSQLILMDAHGHPTTIGLSDSLAVRSKKNIKQLWNLHMY